MRGIRSCRRQAGLLLLPDLGRFDQGDMRPGRCHRLFLSLEFLSQLF